jgi:hypothetical protein
MTDPEHNPDTEQPTDVDEPLIDDDKPMGNSLRYILIALAVGMFVGGIVWNYHRAKELKKRREARKNDLVVTGPRYVAPPPGEAYPWAQNYDAANSIAARIPPPAGTVRVQVSEDSFANWLRYLPVKPGQQKVLLYNGEPKRNQNAHWAVIDIDTGSDDLQQGAEAVLRLHAEYLYARNDFDAISFHVSSKDMLPWNRWRKGDRPVAMEGGAVTWNTQAAKPDDSYANFRKYLDAVFAHADTNTLAMDVEPIGGAEIPRIGDVYVHPGKPGHAVIVVDMVQDTKTGRKGFLLAQSFIPAQDVHILVNAYNPQGSPWYCPDYLADNLRTPEWTFTPYELMRFR